MKLIKIIILILLLPTISWAEIITDIKVTGNKRISKSKFNSWFEEAFGDEGTKFGLAIQEKLHEEQTPYQFLEVYSTETFGNLMVLCASGAPGLTPSGEKRERLIKVSETAK